MEDRLLLSGQNGGWVGGWGRDGWVGWPQISAFWATRQTCEPFVAQYCQNWLVAELVVVLDSGFKVLGSNRSSGFLLVSSALLFHRFACFW